MTGTFEAGARRTGPPSATRIDVGTVEDLARQLLKAIGEDPDRDGLKHTPRRFAAWWSQILSPDLANIDTLFEHQSVGDQWVAVSDIDAWTLCEHHLAPVHLTVTLGYIPAGQVIGLSKLVRIVHWHAAGLQVQERLTTQIAKTLSEVTGSPDVGVWVAGEHLCMSMRGVKAERARATTGCLLGRLRDEPALSDRLLTMSRR